MDLIGTYFSSLDQKHRLNVPAALRQAMAAGGDRDGKIPVLISRGLDQAVYLYLPERFEELKGRLKAQTFSARDRRQFDRLFFASTYPAEIDRTGRVLIPEILREHAGLDKEAVLLGTNDKIEIMSRDRYQGLMAETEAGEGFDELAEKLFGLNGQSAAGTRSGGGESAGGA